MLKQLIYSNGKDELRISCPENQVESKQKMFSKLKEYKSYKIIDIIDIDETLFEYPPESPKIQYNYYWN